jgi:hypothetical protein
MAQAVSTSKAQSPEVQIPVRPKEREPHENISYSSTSLCCPLKAKNTVAVCL